MEQKVETEAQTPSEFSNENLKVKVHFKPNCKVELEVHALPPLLKDAYRKAVKVVGREVTLPGFRKGKAPEALVEKSYAKQIDTEWQQAIADLSFQGSSKLI